jgi:hypothetical protein
LQLEVKAEVEQLIRKHGGELTANVRHGKTDYMVAVKVRVSC